MGYDAGSIQVLENRDAVRQRPGMYIGGTGPAGLHHLVWEIVDNSVDEAMNGYASTIEVTLHDDSRTVTVTDNGRGIPVAKHPERKVSTLQVVLTVLHSGGKFGGGSYGASGGLHGVGASVVNFLSARLEARVWRDKGEWVQTYTQGTPDKKVKRVGSCAKSKTGTEITFTPDPEIFGDESLDPELIRDRLEVKAYLNKGVRIIFRTRDTEDTFQHDGGVEEFLDEVVRKSKTAAVHSKPIVMEQEQSGVKMAIALQWTEGTSEQVLSFANTIPTASGGTHESGFKAGIVRAMKAVLDVHGSVPKSLDISSEDIREGIKAIVSVVIESDLEIEGQTKEKLNNTEVQPVVASAVRAFIEQWMLANSSTAQTICNRIVQAAKARAASRAAARHVSRKKPVSKKLTLPGKLADCTSTNPAECELFIVEGDSAGGNAKQARDRKTQAVLPLRGKILNTESATMKSVLKNREITDIVEALGCGLDNRMDLSKLRYNTVILLMDADSDGHHIATLLLTFFYRYMPDLVKGGHLYIAQPPLYKITSGSEIHWAADDVEKDALVKKLNRKKYDIARFKGLGEMQKEALRETALDPQTRSLIEVEVPAALEDAIDDTISSLMGRNSAARYDFIMSNLSSVQDLDI